MPPRVARLLVHVEAVDRIMETVNGRQFLTIVHLTDEFKLRGLRQAREHDVWVDFLGDLLRQAMEAFLDIHSFREEIDGIPAPQVPKAEKLSVTRTPSFLGVNVETLLEGLPGRHFIRRLSMSKDGDVRRPGGDKEGEGEQATVNLFPRGAISIVRLRFRRTVGLG